MPMPNDMAETLLGWRKSLGKTQREMADMLGVSRRGLQRWEAKELAVPAYVSVIYGLHQEIDRLRSPAH